MALELIDRALDDVALLVAVRVERGWAACAAATTHSVACLIRGLGNCRNDPTSSQVGTDRPAGVGLIAQHPPGSGPRAAGSAAANPDPGHHRFERQRVVAMSSGGDPGDRPAAAIGGKVSLARQAAPGPPERLSAGLGGRFSETYHFLVSLLQTLSNSRKNV